MKAWLELKGVGVLGYLAWFDTQQRETYITPGSHPSMHNRMLSKSEKVQNPFTNPTATGGSMTASNTVAEVLLSNQEIKQSDDFAHQACQMSIHDFHRFSKISLSPLRNMTIAQRRKLHNYL